MNNLQKKEQDWFQYVQFKQPEIAIWKFADKRRIYPEDIETIERPFRMISSGSSYKLSDISTSDSDSK